MHEEGMRNFLSASHFLKMHCSETIKTIF